MEWEQIEENLYKAKLSNGWLYKQASYVIIDKDCHRIDSICFVPEDNTWESFLALGGD